MAIMTRTLGRTLPGWAGGTGRPRASRACSPAAAGLTSLTVVETMHERKAAMSDAADAFVMLPGGYGAFDECFEAVTWTQLGIHDKPCGVAGPV